MSSTRDGRLQRELSETRSGAGLSDQSEAERGRVRILVVAGPAWALHRPSFCDDSNLQRAARLLTLDFTRAFRGRPHGVFASSGNFL